MTRLVFATYHGLPNLNDDERLVFDCLRDYDITAEPAIWDDPSINWSAFDAVIIRCCWDYHRRPQEFLSWIGSIECRNVPLWNPASIVRWNAEKTYLQQLSHMGIAIPPTIWIEKGSTAELAALLQECKWKQAVVKPTISATAFHTWLVTPSSAENDEGRFQEMLRQGNVMIQLFIDEIRTKGEWSFLFFGKKYSHAVLKRTRQCDFRVQDTFGGFLENAIPPETLIEQAQKIVELIEEPLLFARVDGIEVDNALLLMELELIEPALFLGQGPRAPQYFASAIAATIL